jgi:hypothetical protein
VPDRPQSEGGAQPGGGLAHVLSDSTDANGVRSVVWTDGDGNTWGNDGVNPTFFVGTNTGTGLVPGETPPSTPPPPPPPPADPPPDDPPPDEEDPPEEDPPEEEDEEGDDMVNPDADDVSGVSGIDTGEGVLRPDYGSATGAGVTDFGRGDLGVGLGEITGELITTNTAGPDVNPDAAGDDVLALGGVLQPDFGSATGAGVTDFGRGDLSTGLGPIELPTDDGVNPYADTAASFNQLDSGMASFDSQIGGVDQLADAALDVSFDAHAVEADEPPPPGGFDGTDDGMFG